ncbi:MAG: flap endonuclease-1 [Candidatus Anstonellales archaeon]
MGAEIGQLIEGRKVSLNEISGRIFAVDAYNAIYQFLSSTRQADGTPLMNSEGKVTGHLAGIFYRNSKLIENGIRVVYVFDGRPPDFKERTMEERRKVREEAEENWKDAIERGEVDEARKYAQAANELTKEMVEDSKKLLEYMGIPFIQAPSEGEAQAAEMARNGLVYAVASQDADSLLFGAPRLLRNLSITGRRKVPRKDEYVLVEPEVVELEEILRKNGLSRKKLIWLGILVGTDFNKGIKGIGVKKGLKIVRQSESLEKVKTYVERELKASFDEDVFAIENFFLNPPVIKEIELKFGVADRDNLEKFLCEKHDFSPERVRKTAESLIKSQQIKGKQTELSGWFE